MKYIVLSFDDGRKDFYSNVLPVLKKYNLPATLNIITDYLGRNDLVKFASANYECITDNEMIECAKSNIEIACHSANHTNDVEEIEKGVDCISRRLGIKWGGIGFASPESQICKQNITAYVHLLKESKLHYIRSGNQIKRDGILHAGLYVLYRVSKSKLFFYLYNKRNVVDLRYKADANSFFYPSITCNADNNIKQLVSFIAAIPDNHAAIIMFHSILKPVDIGWGKDRWYNSLDDFEKFCRWLKKKDNIAVITNADLHTIYFGDCV